VASVDGLAFWASLLAAADDLAWEESDSSLLSFSRDCAARDFLLLSFARIFNELYLAQIWMKCLDILYVDCCTYILGACKFIEPENTSL
jgi:hypothetical protein